MINPTVPDMKMAKFRIENDDRVVEGTASWAEFEFDSGWGASSSGELTVELTNPAYTVNSKVAPPVVTDRERVKFSATMVISALTANEINKAQEAVGADGDVEFTVEKASEYDEDAWNPKEFIKGYRITFNWSK